jgi:DNA replication ATP-dependent helicase Dna2
MMQSTADLLHRLRRFVQAEADTQYENLSRQWSRPIGERVANGWAIEGLNVIHEKQGMIRLVCDTNDSRFREGDLLVLHQERESPKSPNALHV